MEISEIVGALQKVEQEIESLAQRNLDFVKRHEKEEGMKERTLMAFCRMSAYNQADRKVKSLLRRISNSFGNYYFTFGSWEKFPYQNAYLIVKADNMADAIQKFVLKYPSDGTECTIMCSDYYAETPWREYEESDSFPYTNQEPAEIIY